LVIGLGAQVQGQDLFMKVESESKGMPFGMDRLAKSTTLAYYRDGQSKVETTIMGKIQTVLTEENRVIVTNPDLCGVFTKGELMNDGLEDAEYKDVVVSLSDETKNLLGYTCKKAVIKYKLVGLGDYNYESIYWYTEELKAPDNSDLPSIIKPNALTEEIGKFGGVVLLTETTMKMSGVKTISRVTKVSTEKISDQVFLIKTKDCEKPKNLEEYKKAIRLRQASSSHMGY